MKQNEGRRFVELEWVCPNCQGVNRGSQRTCESCGAPQPENVQFRRAANEKIIEDEKLIQAAQAGADIHCGYCGTRNPANAATCSQCGADLKEGKRREAGQTLAAPEAPQPQICGACGTENSPGARLCVKCGAPLARPQTPPPAAPEQTRAAPAAQPKNQFPWLWAAAGIAALLACCALIFFLFLTPSKSVQGTVTALQWRTFVAVQEQQPKRYINEAGSPPPDAYNVSCETRSEESCTTRMEDKGNGFAEEVTECTTHDTQYCDYTLDEWTTVQTYALSGNDNHPVYDSPVIVGGQRLGERSEELSVTFSTPEGIETYKPSSVAEFEQFEIGSQWTLTFNALGGVISVER